ncbi:NAD(P)/FAD-dependent oxidoreductase [Streptomyces sp. SP18CS02]|uniref:NAD(P)/FAD-dependent oxidoreductase n=1 Tax=Streptomyces sp. SP18CS02 TaxID=3002531 RepID=UPI002E779226|nr:FAD-dependent oxidoreductase [Streptomyces sp. SP18CS02]MEE1754081.1 FAD-dependent oxidoreductase [Streptomyces sp. SP18CS02]
MRGDVVVVGGGVIGLTTALTLAERGARVRVWTRDGAGETTSATAGALWWPYRIEPGEQAGAWALESLRVYGGLARDAARTGVRMVAGVHAGVRLDGLGPWAREVAGLRGTAPGELPGAYAAGVAARLPLIDMPVHLAWLRGRLEAAGGAVESRTVASFGEAAAEADVVVNCTGLAARELVPDDGMRAVRGQLVWVENPGVEEWFTAADAGSSATTYFFPQPGRLVLGGTAEEGDERTEPDGATAAAIVERCARIRPEIADARVLAHRVGLRPARVGGVRLAAGRPAGGDALLVHNYGHGGAGVTVAWGCARAAAGLVP